MRNKKLLKPAGLTRLVRPAIATYLAIAGLGASSSLAAVITGFTDTDGNGHLDLGDLVSSSGDSNGGSFTIGNKTFSDFTYSADGTAPAASAITIQGEPGVSYGIRFGGHFYSLSGANGDALIDFDVTAGAGSLINSTTLDFNGTASGTAFAEVSETVTSGDPAVPVGALSVVAVPAGQSSPISTTTLNFATPVQSIHVSKDIELASVTGNNFSNISYVDNSFTQVVTAVPEPVAMTTLGLIGSIAMLGRRRRI